MLTRRNLMTALAAAGGYSLLPGFALAQNYPNRPIRLVIGFAAGGIGDLIGRAVAEKSSALLGQPVIVENRTGAGGLVSMQFVARDQPDGHTLLQMTGAMIGATLLQPDVNFDLEQDFTPVIGIGSFPCLICTSNESSIETFDDIVSAGEAGDGLTYASGGIGSMGHLVMVALLSRIGVDGLHIPFRGNIEGIQALLGRQVDLAYVGTPDGLEMVTSGRLRAVAVAAPERLAALPGVPTMAELGHGDFSAPIWYGYTVAAGTPPEIVAALYEAISVAAQDPELAERYARFNFLNTITDGPAFGALLKQEAQTWGAVIREHDITLE